jgi:hypothetical protein
MQLVGRELKYEEWNELIFQYFFRPQMAHQEVFFSVEKDSLADISGLPSDIAIESFRKAVLSLVSANWTMRIVTDRVKRWGRSDSEKRNIYPAVGFLAFSVLAASMMGEEEWAGSGFSTANFYGPLRRLLNSKDNLRGAPHDYGPSMEFLWKEFATWINDDLGGDLGHLRIVQPPPERRYVELSIQHAIWRSSDRRRLDDFFDDVELRHHRMSSNEIRRHLVSWCKRRSQNWALRILNVLEDPNLSIYCDKVLEYEVARYLEETREILGGDIRGRIRLMLNFDHLTFDPNLELVLSANKRHPSLLRGSDDQCFEKDPVSGWFTPPIADKDRVREAFSNGCTISIQQFKFSFDCEECYVFSMDSNLNSWVSRPKAELGQLHCLLIPSAHFNDAYEFLESVCSEEFNDEVGVARFSVGEPGYDWVVIKNFRINIKFNSEAPRILRNIFDFSSGFRLKVDGGLPIGPVPNTFLLNGEPTLLLSESDNLRVLKIESDVFGKRELPLDISGREIDMWMLPLRSDPSRLGMDVGLYSVSDSETTLRIEITAALVEEAGPGADQLQAESREGTVVKGTYSDEESLNIPPMEISVRYGPGKVTYRDGSTETVGPPLWLSKKNYLGPLSWDTVDFWPKSGCEVESVVERDRESRVDSLNTRESVLVAETHHTAGDELLRWVSESGSGTWEQLRRTSKYLMERHKLNRRDSLLASNLSKLGHLEIDWTNSRWSVVKPTINVIPGMGLIVVMSGSRPQIVEDRFERATDDVLDVFALPLFFQSDEYPHVRMLKCGSLNEAESIAKEIRARFVVDPSSRLAKSMISLEELGLRPAAEPHKIEFDGMKVFDHDARSWRSISSSNSCRVVDGLFEVPGWGRQRYLLRRGNRWFQIDKSYGLFHEYQRIGRNNVMHYRRQTESQPSFLHVDKDVVLPILAERTLVMCSGLAPRSINQKTTYLNVPKHIASYVASKLGQEI